MKTCVHCHAENPDDARYCQRCRFALDWGPEPEPEPGPGEEPTTVMDRVDGGALQVTLEPETVRLSARESAAVRVRVRHAGDGDVTAALHVSGDPAGYATIDPVTLQLRGGEEALALLEIGPLSGATEAMDYEVAATPTDATTSPGVARGRVEPARQPNGTTPSRRWLWLALVALVAAVVIGVLLLDGDDGIDATAARDSALRADPSVTAARIRPGLPAGTRVQVDCVATGPGPDGPASRWYRLLAPPDRANGAFTFNRNLSVASEPPTC